MKKQKPLILRVAAVLSTAFLMTSFVAYKSGAFRPDMENLLHQEPVDTLKKSDSVVVTPAWTVTLDSSFIWASFMPSSKSTAIFDPAMITQFTITPAFTPGTDSGPSPYYFDWSTLKITEPEPEKTEYFASSKSVAIDWDFSNMIWDPQIMLSAEESRIIKCSKIAPASITTKLDYWSNLVDKSNNIKPKSSAQRTHNR